MEISTISLSRSFPPLKLRHRKGLAGLSSLMVLAVCWSAAPVEGTTTPGPPTSIVLSVAAAVPPSSTPELMKNIFEEPKKYLDREVTVEGVLMAEGRGLAVTFFLGADSGARLEVDAWAPLEVYHPREGKAQARSMANYIGRRWRLTGRLRDQGGRIILQVSSAEELP